MFTVTTILSICTKSGCSFNFIYELLISIGLCQRAESPSTYQRQLVSDLYKLINLSFWLVKGHIKAGYADVKPHDNR
jgi:hypothetical protein